MDSHLALYVEAMSALAALAGGAGAIISWTVRSFIKSHARESKLREELIRAEIKAAAQDIRIRFEKLSGSLESYVRQTDGDLGKQEAIVKQLRTDLQGISRTVDHLRKKVGT